MRGREGNWEAREAGEIPPSRHGNGGRGYPSRGGRFDRGGGRGGPSRGNRDGRGRGGLDVGARGIGGRGRRADAPPFRGGRTGGRGPFSRGGRNDGGRIDGGRGRGRGDGRGRMDGRGGRNTRYNDYPRSRAPEDQRASNGSYDDRFHREQHEHSNSSRDHDITPRPASVQAFPPRPRAPSNGSEGEILSESELTPPPPGDNQNNKYPVGPPPTAIRVDHDRRPSPNHLNQRWDSSMERQDRRDDGRHFQQPVAGFSGRSPSSSNDRFPSDRRSSHQMDRTPAFEDNRRLGNEATPPSSSSDRFPGDRRSGHQIDRTPPPFDTNRRLGNETDPPSSTNDRFPSDRRSSHQVARPPFEANRRMENEADAPSSNNDRFPSDLRSSHQMARPPPFEANRRMENEADPPSATNDRFPGDRRSDHQMDRPPPFEDNRGPVNEAVPPSSSNDRFLSDRRPIREMDHTPTFEDNRRVGNEAEPHMENGPRNVRDQRFDGHNDHHGSPDRRPSSIPFSQPVANRDRSADDRLPPIQQTPGPIVEDRPDSQPNMQPHGSTQHRESQGITPSRHMDQRDTFSRGGRGGRIHGGRGRGREGRGHEFPLEPHRSSGPGGGRGLEGRGVNDHRAPGRSFEGRGRRAPGPGRSFEGRGRDHSRPEVGRGIEGRGHAQFRAPGIGRGFEGRGREYGRADGPGRFSGGRGHEQHRAPDMSRSFGRLGSGGSFDGRGREHSIDLERNYEGRGFLGRGSRAMGGRPMGGARPHGGRMEDRGRGAYQGGRGNDRPWKHEDHVRPISPRSSHEEQPQPPYSYHEPRLDDSRRSELSSISTEPPTTTRSFASFALENDLMKAKTVSSSLLSEQANARSPSPAAVPSHSYNPDTKQTPMETEVVKPKTLSPTPPPEPSAPSAYIMSLTRLAEIEAQMEFEFAKLTRLSMKRQLVRAEQDTLATLPIGRDAFQEDLDKYVAELGVKETDEAKEGADET